MKDFNDKVVVITGAASGMGRAYAIAFAGEGSLLALCDVDREALDETIRLVEGVSKKKIISELFDISDEQSTYEFASKVKKALGNAYIVINNAGIEGSAKPVWATSQGSYQKLMEVNFFGVVHSTRAFLPQMLESDKGAIVNVSSIFGLVGTPNHTDYCASKFAVRGFTEALMVELSTSNIQIHLLHPGGINTNIARQGHSKDFAEHFLITPAEDVAQYVIRCIRKNKVRIVYGNSALKTWLGSFLLPLSLLKKMIWYEMKSVIDMSDYDVVNKRKGK